jgi:hypothetical protein
MRRLLGHLAPLAVLGALLATTGGGQARGGPIDMTVTITDVTTSVTTVFTIHKGGPFDGSNPANPNSLISNGTFETVTTATGLDVSGLTATSNNPGTTSAVLSIGGTVQVVSGVGTSSDQFMVTIDTSQTFFTNPPGQKATLAESHGYTVTNTTGAASDQQMFTSWYDPTNTLYGKTSPVGPSTLALPAASGIPVSNSSPTLTAGINPYSTPYSLTNEVVIAITGNDSDPNAKNVFTGQTTLTATIIPEPASLVIMMTSMPLPLVVLGLLRRRRRRAA